jgi:hypothetical protein
MRECTRKIMYNVGTALSAVARSGRRRRRPLTCHLGEWEELSRAHAQPIQETTLRSSIMSGGSEQGGEEGEEGGRGRQGSSGGTDTPLRKGTRERDGVS